MPVAKPPAQGCNSTAGSGDQERRTGRRPSFELYNLCAGLLILHRPTGKSTIEGATRVMSFTGLTPCEGRYSTHRAITTHGRFQACLPGALSPVPSRFVQ